MRPLSYSRGLRNIKDMLMLMLTCWLYIWTPFSWHSHVDSRPSSPKRRSVQMVNAIKACSYPSCSCLYCLLPPSCDADLLLLTYFAAHCGWFAGWQSELAKTCRATKNLTTNVSAKYGLTVATFMSLFISTECWRTLMFMSATNKTKNYCWPTHKMSAIMKRLIEKL